MSMGMYLYYGARDRRPGAGVWLRFAPPLSLSPGNSCLPDGGKARHTNAGTATTSQGTGTTFIADAVHLHGPLDLALTPTGHLLVADSDGSNADPNQPSELVEYNAAGQFVTQYSVDPNNGGAFGLAIESVGWGTLRVAAVDDNQNTLKVWTVVVL